MNVFMVRRVSKFYNERELNNPKGGRKNQLQKLILQSSAIANVAKDIGRCREMKATMIIRLFQLKGVFNAKR